MRHLTLIEQERVKALTNKSVAFTMIEPTATGLKKSILDATSPVRRYFLEHAIHDYQSQAQGGTHKRIVKARLLNQQIQINSRASLYRPQTKKGDPRIWFRNLTRYSDANDILAIVAYDGILNVINLTQVPVDQIIQNEEPGFIWELVQQIFVEETSIATELLVLMREIGQRGFIRSQMDGRIDTAVGRTLETLLGIEMNSSLKPDYKGIELKTSRKRPRGSQNRSVLFAQVPNWKLSKFKSSREILENFGYFRDDKFRLYCTVNTNKPNSQGLMLRFDENIDQLFENSDKREIGDFVTWLMQDLRTRLLEKHNETFWIRAESLVEDGQEFFHYKEIRHTRKPIASQFDILLEQGLITIDHLISKNSKGRVSEKGPLFKIAPSGLDLLFPPSVFHDLMA